MLIIFCYLVIKFKQVRLSLSPLCFNIILLWKNGLFSQRIRLRHLHTFVAVAQQERWGARLNIKSEPASTLENATS